MAIAASVLFYDDVALAITRAVLVVMVVIELVAFVNCLTQRADAFPVVGSLSKAAWLGILGASVLVTILCFRGPLGILAFAAVTAATLYLLDVRPALRDAANGSGSW